MLPLSFTEFSKAVKTSDKRDRFNQFLNMGGFPYAARFVDNSLANHENSIEHKTKFCAHSQYLEGIYNTVLVKDVILLKSIASFLASNIGSPVSAKKIADTLSSNGPPTGSATVDLYLEALCDAYLFYKVNRYDIKGRMHLKSESKYFICDTGLRNMILGIKNKDKVSYWTLGHQIENIVFLELLRRGYSVNTGKSGRNTEIDFVAFRDKKNEYFQVSATVLDEATLERELKPFTETNDNYPKFLITLDDFTGDHKGIQQLNLIDWLNH